MAVDSYGYAVELRQRAQASDTRPGNYLVGYQDVIKTYPVCPRGHQPGHIQRRRSRSHSATVLTRVYIHQHLQDYPGFCCPLGQTGYVLMTS